MSLTKAREFLSLRAAKLNWLALLPVIIILIVASALRFYDYFSLPYTHDEMSALLRTHYSSFRDLIEQGIKPDGHPPLIQIFLYCYTKIFGYSEWLIKLPFTLCGLGVVVYAYLTCRKIYSETASLIITSCLASMKIFVMYSQIARPYITGVFFIAALMYYLISMIEEREHFKKTTQFFFILFILLSAYNHHISFFTSLILVFFSFFFINRSLRKRYVLLVLISVVLYLPNLPVFFAQLRLKGLSWLGAPDNLFLLDFFKYITPYFYIVFPLICLLCLCSYVKNYKEDRKIFRFNIVLLLTFLIVFLTTFLYSKLISPIIQYSTLIFPLPVLIFFVFGRIKDVNKWLNFLFVCIVLLINTASIVFEKDYYTRFYNSVYEKIPENMLKAEQNYENILFLKNNSDAKIDFYAQKFDKLPQSLDISVCKTEKDIVNFVKKLREQTDYVYFGALGSENPIWESVLLDYFPYVADLHNYQLGSTKVFATRQPLNKKSMEDNYSMVIQNDSTACFFDGKTEWGRSFTVNFKEKGLTKYDYIDLTCEFLADGSEKGQLVVELKNGEKEIWRTNAMLSQYNEPINEGVWQKLYLSVKLSDCGIRDLSSSELKTYIWNQGLETFKVRNFTIRLRKGNPIIYSVLD
ncbi:MAG: glycosyltransferase family 39 protein [Bacteroidales bacterium]|nr:glycosyltransferase family 39 protein [Bacteroidales bacterium]